MTFIAREPKKINIRLIRKGKSYEAEEVLRRLRSFLDRNEAEPVKILRGFWKDQQDALSYGEIREAILAGHISEQTIREWRQDYAKLVNEQFSHTWKNALAVGYKGQPIMDNLSTFHFDMQKPGVLSWIGERGAEFVTNESQTTKDAIRGLLMRSVTEKHSVDELSRVIRPLVGLNKPQAYANMRYYENVLNTLSEQHPRTSKEVIQRRAQEAAWKYAEKQHRERAYMIARTEMSFAYNRGAYEGIKQAQELGLMGAVVKIWSTSQGGNVCPDCEALEGEEVGMEDTWGDKFPSRGLFRGDNLVPPLHPRCECAIVYQEVATRDVGGLKSESFWPEVDVPELSEDEEKALRNWVSPDAYLFNDKCRTVGYNGLSSSEKERYNSLISAIDKLPNSNTTLNRSLCFSDAKSAEVWYNNIITGEKFETDSFWATTKNYIHNPMGQVQIYIQRAKSGGDLGRYGLSGESEVLFKPGTRFYVDRKEIFNATGIKGQEKFYIFLTEV